MRHTWHNDTCDRCGLVRIHKTKKVLIHNKFGATYIQHYTQYYQSDLMLKNCPPCYELAQTKLKFNDN